MPITNGFAANGSNQWPEDVGIIAMEVYFPNYYVDQAQLEKFDGVSEGKYTVGLGQSQMGFCTDREDINSLCLTVVEKLMERNRVAYQEIGRLEVGTETIVDKSKSVKTVLMQLFEGSGNSSVEGIDTVNACYGGTAALFNAVSWVESSAWDGRYALVVAGDIAIYATGNARPTGGAGAIAMLVGPHAPIVLDRGLRGVHMQHAYDFYKPDLSSEYPVVDGKLSIECYLSALDKCYQRYCAKADGRQIGGGGHWFSLEQLDGMVFHSPFCKLVQKSVARLFFNDLHRDPCPDCGPTGKYAGLEALGKLKLEETFFDKSVEKALMASSKSVFEQKTRPSLLLANQVGNMYTPSLYGGLASYLAQNDVAKMVGNRIGLFSYGSGLASTMFSVTITKNKDTGTKLDRLVESLRDLKTRLAARICIDPQKFSDLMKLREDTHHLAPYVPSGEVKDLLPGTWYLEEIDAMHRRKYASKPVGQEERFLNGSDDAQAKNL